jgi:xanthine dehydrogenase accessory factor
MSRLVDELIRIQTEEKAAALATVVQIGEALWEELGHKLLVSEGRVLAGEIKTQGLVDAILEKSGAFIQNGRSQRVSLILPGAPEGCGVFFDVMVPRPFLIVVGAGHIAVPLVRIARVLDFRIVVVDDRVQYANRERFPDADEVIVGDMAEMLKTLPMTAETSIVLITRGHKYDEPCLREIIGSRAGYIGMIGSRRRISACFERFREDNYAEELIQRVYAPIGLAIRSETPEEIAISILAEIVKVRRGGRAQSLSDVWRYKKKPALARG